MHRCQRPVRKQWVTDIRDQCVAAGVPFFFKQWGGVVKKRNGRLPEGRTWEEMPGVGTAGAKRIGPAIVSRGFDELCNRGVSHVIQFFASMTSALTEA